MARLVAGILAAFLASSAALADCDECEDLCRLMDVYLQKEKGVELWSQYAASTPFALRSAPPLYVNDTTSMENYVWEEFSAWTQTRRLPCSLPVSSRLKNLLGLGGGVATDLVTDGLDPKCTIYYGNDDLESGDTKERFAKDVDCKALSDAVIEHEQVHQTHCRNAFAANPAIAAKEMDRPENVAESELQAWTRHKQVVEAAIRNILATKGCGWQPTSRQLADPSSLPTVDQMKGMQERAWKAAQELSPPATK